MENLLEINNVSKRFEDFSLKDIGFNLKKGYIMGFIGPNGAGKTTTIKLIMNLLHKDEGEIRVFGLDNKKDERLIKDRIGFVYDENYFYEELTVQQMKGVIAPFYSNWDELAFIRYLKEFELPSRKKIKDLSKGMKMKFSLALALSHDADLLVMDEPTSGLDPVFRVELLDVLRDFMSEEKGILFSTHVTSDLDKVADYITLINKGEIVLSASKEEVMDQYGLVKGEKRDLDDWLRDNLIGFREGSLGFEGLTSNRQSISKMGKNSLIVERPSLEDIMLYTVRRGKNV